MMGVSGRIYTELRDAWRDKPVIGSRCVGGGIYLDQEEARWLTELIGRLSVCEGKAYISQFEAMQSHEMSGFSEYVRGACKHDVARKIADELTVKSEPDLVGGVNHAVTAYVVRGGLPDPIDTRRRTYKPQTIDLEPEPRNMPWSPPSMLKGGR